MKTYRLLNPLEKLKYNEDEFMSFKESGCSLMKYKEDCIAIRHDFCFDESKFFELYISQNSNIRKLNISGCKITKDTMKTIFNSLKFLENLDLSCIIYEGEIASCLHEQMSHSNASIKHLNLSGNTFSFEDAKYIASILTYNESLQSIGLANCDICTGKIYVIAEAVRYSSSLNSIDLSNNSIGFYGICALAKSIKLGAQFSHLFVSNCDVVFSSNAHHSILESLSELCLLDVSYNHFNIDAYIDVCQNLDSLVCMQNLNLNGIILSEYDIGFICSWLKSPKCNIEDFSIGSCGIDIISLEKILNALNENFSLSNLSLASNNLDNVCISAISLFLEKNETLKSIDLSCNVVTDLGAKSLGFSMLQNYTVINMNLRNNVLSTNLYDEMIKRYCSRNLQLRYYLTRLEFCRVMQFKCPHIDKYIVTSLIFPMTFQ
jgi:hypothetical protein